MILQITQLPGSGQQLAQALANLGAGLGQIVSPNREEKRQIRMSLLQNPQLAQQLQRAQTDAELEAFQPIGEVEAGEEEAEDLPAGEQVSAEGVTPALAPEEPPNVLKQFGFSPEETREALAVAPPLTPQQQAAREEAKFNKQLFRELREKGVAPREAAARARGAEAQVAEAGATEAEAGFREQVFEQLDPQLAAQARMIESQTSIEMGEKQLETLQTLDSITQDQPEFMRLAFAGPGGRAMLQGILDMERLGVRERLDRLQLAQDKREFQQEMLKTRVEFRNELVDRIDGIEQLMKEQPEGWEETLRARLSEFNETASLIAEQDPRATSFVAKTSEQLLGGVGVKFEAVPGFLQAVQNRPEILDNAMQTLTQARQSEAPETFSTARDFVRERTQQFLEKPGARQIISKLPQGARARFISDIQDNLRRAFRDRRMPETEGGGGVSGAQRLAEGLRATSPAGSAGAGIANVIQLGDAGVKGMNAVAEAVTRLMRDYAQGARAFQQAGGQGGQ